MGDNICKYRLRPPKNDTPPPPLPTPHDVTTPEGPGWEFSKSSAGDTCSDLSLDQFGWIKVDLGRVSFFDNLFRMPDWFPDSLSVCAHVHVLIVPFFVACLRAIIALHCTVRTKGKPYSIGVLKMWQLNYAYCNKHIEISKNGIFRGEEVPILKPGLVFDQGEVNSQKNTKTAVHADGRYPLFLLTLPCLSLCLLRCVVLSSRYEFVTACVQYASTYQHH
jgi:hypothetical protein